VPSGFLNVFELRAVFERGGDEGRFATFSAAAQIKL
jgi:hypothetical protein